ncbi:hypothetical protein RCL1_005667 [Eukaryota sp. TZLM3-RCL]
MASGTSLGSDNGMGMAMAMAVLESKTLQHGPIEALFTVDEETTMEGADKCEADFNSTIIVNLDSEEDSAVCVSSAGGFESSLYMPIQRTEVSGEFVTIVVKDLESGHSGVNINEERGNAIKVMGRIINYAARRLGKSFNIVTFTAGRARNVIPASAKASIIVDSANDWIKLITECFEIVKDEYRTVDPNMTLVINHEKQVPSEAVTTQDSAKIVAAILTAIHGVVRNTPGIDLVQTSTNFALAELTADTFDLSFFSRSSVESEMDLLHEILVNYAELLGARISSPNAKFCGWKPNLEAHSLQVFKDVHKELFGEEPKVYGIHAGLECSIIMSKRPAGSMEALSIGPHIAYPHSVQEQCGISSVCKTMKWLTRALEVL